MPTTNPAEVPLFLTVPEVAALLKVSEATVYAAVADGSLGHVRIGRSIRITPAHLQAFADGEAAEVDGPKPALRPTRRKAS